MFQTPHGIVCENGHGEPPLVGPDGMPVYDPLPDAPLPGPPDPERARTLEARVTALAGQVSRLKAALRGVVTHAFPISDKGTAPWYREAMSALGQVGVDEADDD